MILGFQFPENFNYPYLSRNIREFWTRWHISLSTWLRDYLYIPLGGNRRSVLSKYRNIFVTMVLGGVWHGASWNFVIWGLYHAVLITVSHMIKDKIKLKVYIPEFIHMIITFSLVTTGWFFFRANSLNDINVVVKKLFLGNFDLQIYNRDFFIILFIAIVQQILSKFNFKQVLLNFYVKLGLFFKVLFVLLILFIIKVFTVTGVKPFIYFQF